MRRTLLVSSILAFMSFSSVTLQSQAARAQTSADIQSSRPGAAIGANVVGAKFFQIESGLQLIDDNGAEVSEQDTWVTELRYGLSEKLELTGEFDLFTQSVSRNLYRSLEPWAEAP